MKAPVLSPDVAHLVHLLFEWMAIAMGVQLYRWQRQRLGLGGMLQPGTYLVMTGCILGAAIGNKLVFWLELPQLWSVASHDWQAWMSGQSIVGGLLGGLIGVEAAKRIAGLRQSTGDQFVLPLIAGTVIGRIGCFLAGLHDGTYGNATGLPWGVDFGDGIARHPTQVYDMLFVFFWGGGLLYFQQYWSGKPGLTFKLYLAGYLFWRLLVDGIKPLPFDYGMGLSGIQVVCLIALFCYVPLIVKQILPTRQHALPSA